MSEIKNSTEKDNKQKIVKSNVSYYSISMSILFLIIHSYIIYNDLPSWSPFLASVLSAIIVITVAILIDNKEKPKFSDDDNIKVEFSTGTAGEALGWSFFILSMVIFFYGYGPLFTSSILGWIFYIVSLILWTGMQGFLAFALPTIPGKIQENVNNGIQSTQSLLEECDQNDMDIVIHEAELESMLDRVNTYTLEAALISALGFSAFISILVASDDSPKKIREWGNNYINSIEIIWEKHDISTAIYHMVGNPQNISFFISTLLIISSMLFLAVLLCRLRFSEAHLEARKCLQVAKAINDRENSKIDAQLGDVETKSIDAYKRIIRDNMKKVSGCFKEINPLIKHMAILRNLGMVFFVIILIISAGSIHQGAAAILSIIFISSYLFGIIQHKMFFRSVLQFGRIGRM